MNRKIKRMIATVLFGLSTVLLLASCGGNAKPSPKEAAAGKTAAELLEDAAEKSGLQTAPGVVTDGDILTIVRESFEVEAIKEIGILYPGQAKIPMFFIRLYTKTYEIENLYDDIWAFMENNGLTNAGDA